MPGSLLFLSEEISGANICVAPIPITATRKNTEFEMPDAAREAAPIRPTITLSMTPIITTPSWARAIGPASRKVSRKSLRYNR